VTAFKYRLRNRPPLITVEDFRDRARKALPSMVWSYVDFGAESNSTMESNRNAFARYAFRTRVLAGAKPENLNVTIAGKRISLPVLLAPIGLAGLVNWSGELGAAQAAERCGTVSIVSTSSTYTFEEIASGTSSDNFFQLYPCSDEGGIETLTERLMVRALDAGYAAMFVTLDVQALGNRESERKQGVGNPPVLTPSRILSAAVRPRWWFNFLFRQRISAKNLLDQKGARAAMTSTSTLAKMFNPELNWDHLAWMRETWKGPLFVKGILSADDAERAADLGVDGVVVSNHGGRQLDGAVATLDALPAIAQRVGGRVQVILDGGVRRGSDVVKALCLGADAVCVGRPYVYGLAVSGSAGAERVVEIFREEIQRTLTLMGVRDLKELDASWLVPADTPIAT
jgi:isopentenyl diphosphate isomerase/L-lactate dehydrogenase-like FMN-dependent dehydrogenase